MKRILSGAVVVSAILLAASLRTAAAADLGVKAPPAPVVPPAYNWTGFYVGAEGGYAWAYPQVTDNFGVLTGQSVAWANHGGFGGGFAGAQYEFMAAHIVLGVEGEYNAASIRGNTTSGVIATAPLISRTATLNSFGSADARVGIAFTGMYWDRMLLYIVGGIAFGDPKQTATTVGVVPVTTATFDGGEKTGWDFGAGIDYELTPNWILRGEWRMYNFPVNQVTVPAALGTNIGMTETVNVARGGVLFKF